MLRLLVVRAIDHFVDLLVFLRCLFAIAAALGWRLLNLPAGRRKFRGALLLAAVAIAAMVALFCAANAHGGNIVDVTQTQQKQVCTLGGCRIERIPQKDIGVVVGQIADGSWIALGHARKFQLGHAQIDLGDGSGPVRATIFARNPRLDLSLLKFEHSGWLPCRPLDHDQEARNWIVTQLGTLPVAPPRTKDVIASADQTPGKGGTPMIEEIPPPRTIIDGAPAPMPQPSAPAAPASESFDWKSVIERAAQEGAKAAGTEVKKLQAEHGQQLRNDYAQAIAAQRKAGSTGLTSAKQAAIGVLKSEGPALLKEALKDSMPAVASGLKAALPSLGSLLGIAALGATGPVGIGLAVGGLLLRSLKKLHQKNHNDLLARLNRRPPQQGPTAAIPSSPDNLSPPPKAPPAAASTQETAPPQETVNTAVTQVVTEIGTEAYQRMKADLIKKNPGLADNGTIKLMDSLFTQHLSGLQPAQ